jgi:hypothetical protein
MCETLLMMKNICGTHLGKEKSLWNPFATDKGCFMPVFS